MGKAINNPLISTIITVYNGARYLEEALQSIIDQEYKNIEVIVIDDGSTEEIKSMVLNLNATIQYFYQKNSGISNAKNQGIKMASGDYFAFLDADDLWTKDKIRKQIAMLLDDPSLDMIFGYIKQFYSPELSETERSKSKCPEQAMPGISSVTMLIRRESFFKVGLFDPKWRKGIFNDWYLRADELDLKSYTFPDIFVLRRIHLENHGIVNRDKTVDYVRMLKASLDRKRKSKLQNG